MPLSVLLTARAVSTMIAAGWGDHTAVQEGVQVLLAHSKTEADSKTGADNEVIAALAAYTRHVHTQTHDTPVILPIRKVSRQTQRTRTSRSTALCPTVLRIFK